MPITGGINSILNGINNGSGLQIGFGIFTLALDGLTFGEGSAFSKIGSTGKIGEEALQALGGESQVF